LVRKPAEIRREREIGLGSCDKHGGANEGSGSFTAARKGKAWGSICPDPSSTLALSVHPRF